MNNFKRRFNDSLEDSLAIGTIISKGNLTREETVRLERIREAWNFYEGFHWEGIDDLDSPQVTFNYCRAFVNKYVAFEFGKGFTFKTHPALDNVGVTVNDDKVEVNIDENKDGDISKDEQEKVVESPKTLFDFLEEVWNDNKRDSFITEIGQTKSITGDAWVKVQYWRPEDLDDPYEEYPNGRIRLTLIPTQFVFPNYNDHDKDYIEEIMIMYPIKIEVEQGLIRKKKTENTVMYKEVWRRDKIRVYQEDELMEEYDNPYRLLPFVHIKNFMEAGRDNGVSDMEDIIPLNVELNTKKSDVSEVIDYHSAPITLVYGAKIGNLEKGANKVWGGLPKDSKVENLNLQGDLIASNHYTENLKTSMCEIGGVPESALGGAQSISNTSGVALQYINLPLTDRTRVKRLSSEEGIKNINKLIIFIALSEGLIRKPDNVSLKDFVYNRVFIKDTLPKDELIELQKIQAEFQLGLECRHGAMERLGRDNISQKLAEIDAERQQFPELYGQENPELNSGMTNGNNAIEEVRKEETGQNGTPQALKETV